MASRESIEVVEVPGTIVHARSAMASPGMWNPNEKAGLVGEQQVVMAQMVDGPAMQVRIAGR